MKSVLGAGLENAMLRETMVAGGRLDLGSSHPYYMGLYRPVPRVYFERAATFLAIDKNTILPNVDWSSSMGLGGDPIDEEALGIQRAESSMSEWDSDAMTLAALALHLGAFSNQSKRRLSDVPPPSPKPSGWRRPTQVVGSVGKVNSFALHHLCRLIAQVRTACETGSFLILMDEDRHILTELCVFLAENLIPTPFDLPNLAENQLVSGERFVAGLLNFSPPDVRSAISVRGDPAIQRYAEAVRQHISLADGDVGLLAAMREAMKVKQQITSARTVFEVSSWVMKPLSYIPVMGSIISAFSDLRDVMAKWMERRQSSEEWYLLGAKMQNIAVEEYLARMGNR